MKLAIIALLSALLLAFVTNRSRADDKEEVKKLAGEAAAGEDEPAAKLAQGNNRFGFDLLEYLAKHETGNAVYSPFSLSDALGMTYMGARGETRTQMAKALHVAGEPDALATGYGAVIKRFSDRSVPYDLIIANRLWAQDGYKFLDPFLKTVRTDFAADVTPVDFNTNPEQARQAINGWISERTKGKIADLMPRGSVSHDTRLVLTNAVYLKAKWESEFKTSATSPAPFHLSDSKTVDVPLMHQTGRFKYFSTKLAEAIELPYTHGDLSMVVVLPRRPQQSVSAPELGEKSIAEVLGELKKAEASQVSVFLPRFKTASSFALQDALSALGMPLAFSKSADFSGMNGREDLFISSVVHRAVIDVTEEGTEAAAATGITISATAVRVDPPTVFRADRPFVFLIRDTRSGVILFMGWIANPTT